jgi:hypothetical protein
MLSLWRQIGGTAKTQWLGDEVILKDAEKNLLCLSLSKSQIQYIRCIHMVWAVSKERWPCLELLFDFSACADGAILP